MLTNKNIGLGIAAGLLGGALFALISKGGLLAMLGICLSPLPIMMAGLSLGFILSAIAAAAGILLVSALTAGAATIIYFLWDILPSLLLVFLCLKHRKNTAGKEVWYPIGYMTSWLSVLTAGIAFLTVLTMVMTFGESSAHASASVDFITDIKAMLSHTFAAALPAGVDKSIFNASVDKIAPIFMAAIATTWFMRTVFIAYLGQYILLRKGKALRPKPTYSEVYIQSWVLPVLLILALTALFTSGNAEYVSANFAGTLAIPFFALGLSEIHRWAKQTKYAGTILFIFYTLLALAFLLGLGAAEVFILLAIIGLYEQLLRLRRTYASMKKERK